MEALSDIIQLFRMNVSVYYNAQACGDYHLEATHIGRTVFHMVTKGECSLSVPNEIDTTLHHGDVVFFPREIAHSVRPVGDAFGKQELIPLDQVGDRAGTGIICAEATFNHMGSAHILDALPKVFIVRYDLDNQWSCALIQMIVTESEKPSIASSSILDRLSELLFISALRNYLIETDQDTGLLALYVDARLQKAINAFHISPSEEWTLDRLGKEASMSRTAFAEAFRNASGWTAAKYMTWWRMQLAWSKLSEGTASMIVAEQVGYKSDAAFSRAFKGHFGISAGKVRRGEN